MKTVLSLMCGLLTTSPLAMGQCTFTVSLWESFRATQVEDIGSAQVVGDVFSFRRDGATGPLLVALHNSANLPLSWGDSSQPFNVPQAGPVFSPDPLISQNTFYDHVPSFTGIMMHPGYGAIRCTSIFTAQSEMSVSSMDMYTEVLGNASNGVQVVLKKVLADGTETTITGPITSLWNAPAVHTPYAPLVPVVLHVGDRIVVETSNNGVPTEDWENVELVIHASASPPVIVGQPRRESVCPGANASLSVTAVGATGYQWQREEADIQGETNATLALSGVDDTDSAQYRCIVSNPCGSNTSRYGSLLVRTADIGGAGGLPGGDGVLDNNDFIVFIGRFFAADGRADYGAAGGLPGPDGAFDNNDFIVFINLFFGGCS